LKIRFREKVAQSIKF